MLRYEMPLFNVKRPCQTNLRIGCAFLTLRPRPILLAHIRMVRLKTTPDEDGMATFTPNDLHTAAQNAQLNARFVDGHIALYLAVKQWDPSCVLHRYTIRLDSASTCETSYGFALECNAVVWSLGNLIGWDAIERFETQINTQSFQQWAGGPALSVVFLHEIVDPPAKNTPYVEEKFNRLKLFFSENLILPHLNTPKTDENI